MKKRFTEEQIIGFLREAESGLPVLLGRLRRGIGLVPPSHALGDHARPTSSVRGPLGADAGDAQTEQTCRLYRSILVLRSSVSLRNVSSANACRGRSPYGCLRQGASMPAVLP